MSPALPGESEESAADLARRLFVHVDRLAGLIGARPSSNLRTFEAAATYIESQFQQQGDAVEREWYDANGPRVANLVVSRPGTRHPQDVILLGAHYDTVPETPGADDNASAVAVLLETARLLRNTTLGRSVRFVAFACEEPPHFYTDSMGSAYHARRCRERGDRIRGMLCLEMVGYYSTAENSQRVPEAIPQFLRRVVPKRGDFLAAVGNLQSTRLLLNFRRGFRRGTSLPLFPISLPESVSEIRLSDNASFWDQGYPALMLTDTSFLRNPHYHEPTDLPDTLDYDRMAQVTQGVIAALVHLAGPETGNRSM